MECIGSLAVVSLWEINNLEGFPFYRQGKWGGSVLGNDAVIVACELRDRGFRTRCKLLDPTDADLDCAMALLGSDSVVAVGGHRGEQTRSLCLEDSARQRSWIFSRMPSPSMALGPIVGDIVYVDYYPEFIDFLDEHLQHANREERLIVVNLSTITSVEAIPRLKLKPSVVQASAPINLTLDAAGVLAVELVRATSAERVFVTLGERGAVMAIGHSTWYAKPEVTEDRSFLGAGALFSSEMIVGLARGLDQDSLLQWSVRQTALRLESWRKDESDRSRRC